MRFLPFFVLFSSSLVSFFQSKVVRDSFALNFSISPVSFDVRIMFCFILWTRSLLAIFSFSLRINSLLVRSDSFFFVLTAFFSSVSSFFFALASFSTCSTASFKAFSLLGLTNSSPALVSFARSASSFFSLSMLAKMSLTLKLVSNSEKEKNLYQCLEQRS